MWVVVVVLAAGVATVVSRWTVVLVVAGVGSTTVQEVSTLAVNKQRAGPSNFDMFMPLIRKAARGWTCKEAARGLLQLQE